MDEQITEVEKAEARISRLQAEMPSRFKTDDDRIRYNNEIRRAKNVIRESQGLDTVPLDLTESEISTLISTGLIQEKIKSMPSGAQKERIKQRSKEIRLTNELLENRKENEKIYVQRMQDSIDNLRQSEPEQTIKLEHGKVRENPEFNNWIDRLLIVEKKLDKKIKGIEASGDDLETDKPAIFNLKQQLEALIEA